ncbi:acetylornithine transaminase [Methanobrevibacter sp. OttesenSCG-928-K11]|nr:acetylornithine transaminase [Methanobrevibacter sp. OttesenSCG-928-K11]MDL2270407.1 acetylornithine transaminase [Methanobrevibacter sp. OttesenSCG-928-I08]
MNTEDIKKAEEKYFINTFTRQPIVLDKGHGTVVYDIEGNKYLDFFAGIAVNNVGHTHPKVVNAIKKQAEKLIHISNIYYNKPTIELGEKLVKLSSFDKVFFANSGAEANEGAIKLALKYTGKNEIIATNNSFHGRTIATLTATGQDVYKKDFTKSLPQGFKHVPFGDIESIKNEITDNTAAILIEPIQGEGGVNIPPKGFFEELSKICEENNILLILDEVQTGLGRCGTMFAHELFDVKPDIMTLAKALGGGVPIGAILTTNEIATGFNPGDHGTTFGGGPLICAAASATLDAIVEEDLVENSKNMGDYFKNKLLNLKDKYDLITEVRGYGLMIGIELTQPCGEIVNDLREKGFLVNCTAGKVLRFLPPLIISEEEINQLIDALDEEFENLS